MRYPTNFPFSIKKVPTLYAVADTAFELVCENYLTVRALLTTHAYKDLVGPEDDKEVIFAGIKTREDLENQKRQALIDLRQEEDEMEHDEKAPPPLEGALVEYLQAPVPEGLPPIIIQMKPSGDSSFGMGGGVAGLVFTLWLVYNMGN